MSSSAFPTLFSPLAIGRTVLRNRIIMGSMHTRIETAPNPEARLEAFYRARAKGGVGLIVTGGYAPNPEGAFSDGAPVLNSAEAVRGLKPLARAAQDEGAKFFAQILHTGRYATHARAVGATDARAPINKYAPRALSEAEILRTIEDYARAARCAAEAGCDGVEIMGSEGYLINQFTAARTNTRTDAWGGSLENRLRFPLEILRRVRRAVGKDFVVMYRISALDLVEGGATAAEIDAQAKAVEAAGAGILNTGIGWHEAQIPTIAHMVPRAAWRFAPARLKSVVSIPVVASNRINTPDAAEDILSKGEADLISMARPLLADPEFANKAASGHAAEIAPCIACNQSCLDHIFRDKVAGCLVNPRAGNEIDYPLAKAPDRKRIAIVGAGPAGLAAALTSLERGHSVTLFEASGQLGGQLNLAARIPGKQEYAELLRYYHARVEASALDVKLSFTPNATELAQGGYDCMIIATGARPRTPDISGIMHPKAASYEDVLTGKTRPGARVAILGAGGIGFDVALFLARPANAPFTPEAFQIEWGVDPKIQSQGGLRAEAAPESLRQIYVLQRKPTRPGSSLGATTGWVHRADLKKRNVQFLAGCTYQKIDDQGLHYSQDGAEHILAVDTIVLCAGQEPSHALYDELIALGAPAVRIGGAEKAEELNAARAIAQGVAIAYTL